MKAVRNALAVACFLSCAVTGPGGEQSNSTPATDPRLGKPKDLNGYFPFKPPATREDWARRRQDVREQVLVANGLWPMPEKLPLKPVIHGKIARDGYTIEKVFFASYPGHYVTGNLYRPTAMPVGGKYPAILNPHGHWANGRFYEANDNEVKSQLNQGAEKTAEGAKYPLQARCAQLARLGCIVFFYDMVGYADSKQIAHRTGFTDVEAELRLQSFMGLQTFNSIRALDFLLSLPEVDAKRIGVTGASGGGTQTFILCAIDDRPAAAFPAVMVSTGMQGGCICENCSYLRVGTGNIELAGLFAPKPLGMAAAKDWTEHIETKGLPELKQLYQLLGVPDNVMGKVFLQFGHNYNQVSRELMYNFFNQHLHLGQSGTIVERPFVPVPVSELSVFDDKHPLPMDAVGTGKLREYLTREGDRQLQSLSKQELRRVTGTALRVMMGGSLPAPGEVVVAPPPARATGRLTVTELTLRRKSTGELIPTALLRQGAGNGSVVIWAHPSGFASLWDANHKLTTEAQRILDSGADLLAVEVLRTGAGASIPAMPVNQGYAGYTFGYNHSLLAGRVRDIVAAVAAARDVLQAKNINLIAFDKAGPWAALARGLCGNAVNRTAVDLNAFRFDDIKTTNDEMMLPGALKYGGLPALVALAAPGELFCHNTADKAGVGSIVAAYAAAGAQNRVFSSDTKLAAKDMIDWLLR